MTFQVALYVHEEPYEPAILLAADTTEYTGKLLDLRLTAFQTRKICTTSNIAVSCGGTLDRSLEWFGNNTESFEEVDGAVQASCSPIDELVKQAAIYHRTLCDTAIKVRKEQKKTLPLRSHTHFLVCARQLAARVILANHTKFQPNFSRPYEVSYSKNPTVISDCGELRPGERIDYLSQAYEYVHELLSQYIKNQYIESGEKEKRFYDTVLVSEGRVGNIERHSIDEERFINRPLFSRRNTLLEAES